MSNSSSSSSSSSSRRNLLDEQHIGISDGASQCNRGSTLHLYLAGEDGRNTVGMSGNGGLQELLQELLQDDYCVLLDTLGSYLPNLVHMNVSGGLNDVSAWTTLFQKAPQLESFTYLFFGKALGDEADFQTWSDALQYCTRLSVFQCRVGNRLSPEADGVIDDDNNDDGEEEGENVEDDEDQMSDESDDGIGQAHTQDQTAIVGNRMYSSARPQDFEINRCWDPVLRTLATNNRETLTQLLLPAHAKWSENNLMTHETTGALLNVTNLSWPLVATLANPLDRTEQSFPFTLTLQGSDIDCVVDYLVKVHNEDGVVTHFIPENPLAGIESFLKTLVSAHGMELPSFRLMYNGNQDPGRSKDMFVLLSANLVDPALIKARLTERLQLQKEGQRVRVAEECMHEPKHLVFYQGIQRYNLWQFDPVTASDAQFLDMLAVLGSLGPHGAFFHKSMDYGLQMRFNMLSPQRDRLLRWVERSAKNSSG